MSEAQQGKRLWTDAEDERLRSLWSAGLSIAEIADKLDRPAGSVRTEVSRRRLIRAKVPPAMRERIDELHAEGWRSTRIAQKTGLDPAAIDEILRRAGREPNGIGRLSS